MRKKALEKFTALSICATLCFCSLSVIDVHAAEASTALISIDTTADRKLVSPYIYGINDTASLEGLTVRSIKQGGSRMTTYNWENNYSNSGSDWFNTSDNSLVSDYSSSQQKQVGLAVEKLLTQAETNGIPFTITTLPMAGYVAADGNGPILDSQVAPSSRWIPIFNRKSAPFSMTPDLTDNAIYVDEYINYIVSKFGKSTDSTGVKAYALDNTPDLWSSNHRTIHPNATTIAELMQKTIDLSAVIKALDAHAMVFGGQFSGMSAFTTFQNSADWDTIKDGYTWFIDYYLAEMKKAGSTQGKRLLDVLDLHFISQDSVTDIGTVVEVEDYENVEVNKQRMQAPRTLWDSTYTENSWVGQTCQPYLPLIPTVQASINKNYSGTKLAFSSYNFGGGGHISGGIAQADTLGAFAREGVYQASLSPNAGDISYQKAAINLFTNYDGNGSAFGNTSVRAQTSDNQATSVYASIQNADESVLKIVLINKNYTTKLTADIQINSGTQYEGGTVYGFNSKSSDITNLHNLSNIAGNRFTYQVPPLTVVELILTADGSVPDTTTSDYSYTITETPASTAASDTSSNNSSETTVQESSTSSTLTTSSTASITSISSNTDSVEPPPMEPHDVSGVLKFLAIAFMVLLSCSVIYLFSARYIKRLFK